MLTVHNFINPATADIWSKVKEPRIRLTQTSDPEFFVFFSNIPPLKKKKNKNHGSRWPEDNSRQSTLVTGSAKRRRSAKPGPFMGLHWVERASEVTSQSVRTEAVLVLKAKQYFSPLTERTIAASLPLSSGGSWGDWSVPVQTWRGGGSLVF